MDWGLLAQCVASAMIGGYAIYLTAAGWLHSRYYRRRRAEPEAWKVQPDRWPSARACRAERRLGLFNLGVGNLISGCITYHVLTGGRSALYFDINAHGLLYVPLSAALYFAGSDLFLYWSHRFLHLPGPYRLIHKVHHRWPAPTPFAALAMHPVEFLVFAVALFTPLFFIPLHPAAALPVLIYQFWVGIVDHSGIRLRSVLPWQSPTAFHDDHHRHFHVNYAHCMGLWDRLFGTWRLENRHYDEETFGSNGRAVAGALAVPRRRMAYDPAAVEARSLESMRKKR